jgi:hypothetical protein
MLHVPFERCPSSEAARFASPKGADSVPNVWLPIVEAMSAGTAKFWLSAATANGEYMDFLKRRIKADLAFTHALAGCKSLADVWRTYSDFWTSAASDYRSEFGQFTSQWNAVTADSAAAFAASTNGQREQTNNQMAA